MDTVMNTTWSLPAAWRAAGAVLMITTLGLAVGAAAADGEDGGGPCWKTSQAMRTACGNDVRDDHWVEVAKCVNESSDRKECRKDALDEVGEARGDCADQYAARNEVCAELGPARYDPEIDPADFVSPAEAASNPNPYLPLIPGAEWVYQGGGEENTVAVTGDTKEILGVACTVVHDVVTVGGVPVEDTLDWFAQDVDGNVWYFGEIAQNFEDGELVDIDGSWQAGRDGAKAGIAMPASPEVGDFYRQEFLPGEAEDVAAVVSLDADESAPAASCSGACLLTDEWTPLEPDVHENKYYVAGVGLLLETDAESGDRNAELVSYSIP